VAEAMDCELVVRLVPRGGRSFRDLARKEGAVIVSDSTIQEEKVLEEPAVHSWSQVTESHLL